MSEVIDMVKLTPAQRQTRMRLAFVFGAGIVGFCLWIMVSVGFQIYYGLTSNQWPTTTGMIVKSDFHVIDKAGPAVSYDQNFRYEYAIGGQTYASTNLRFIDGGLPLKKIKGQVKNYPVGQSILVYVHPKNPTVAVLEPGIRLKATAWLVGIIAIFIAILLYGLKLLQQDYQKVKNASLDQGVYIIRRNT